MATTELGRLSKGDENTRSSPIYSHQIWMGDLEPFMDTDFIKSTFEALGVRVKDVKRMCRGGQLARYAFIQLEDPEMMDWVLGLHDYPIPSCPMKRFVLSSALKTKTCRLEYTLFVTNITRSTTDEEFHDFFKSRYPSVTYACVTVDRHYNRKNYGFVRFSNHEERDHCLREMNGATGLGYKRLIIKSATHGTFLTKEQPRRNVINMSNSYSGAWYASTAPSATTTTTDQSDQQDETDSDDEEVDPDPPVDYDEMNSEVFTRDEELFRREELCRWQPVLSISSKLNSKKVKQALEAVYH